jgi:hypothetical protein
MAKEKKGISREKPPHKSMDFDFLRRTGIEFAQKYSGDIWTDYNDHDPGVTILEHLAFAITDLGYRTNFSIQDLLYAKDPAGSVKPDESFFKPFEVFPTGPLTLSDYRKLIIDHIPEIDNAWIQPEENHLSGYEGLFSVLIKPIDHNETDDPERFNQMVRSKVRQLLMKHRNMGEDLLEVRIMKSEPLMVEASVYLSPDADGEQVLARILEVIRDLLSPPISLQHPDDMLREGKHIEDIFDGPLPINGFIKEHDLRSPPASLNISNIREVINKVEGVQNLADVKVRKDGILVDGGEVPIAQDTYLVFDTLMLSEQSEGYPIKLIRNGIEVRVDLFYTKLIYQSLLTAKKETFRSKLDFQEAKPTSNKYLRDIASYFSIQKLFPQIYGVGTYGLPNRSSSQQVAQAKQLKAYLLLFELILASHLAQLGSIKKLFAISKDEGKSYFAQFPFDIPDVDLLLHPKDDNEGLDRRERMEKILEQLFTEFDNQGDRHNRFLDHLLARVGISLDDELIRRMLSLSLDEKDYWHRMAFVKAQFLQRFIHLGQSRYKGIDYSLVEQEGVNLSGLQLGLNTFLEVPDQRVPLKELKGVFGKKKGKTKESDSEGEVEQQFSLKEMLKYGTDAHNYYINYDDCEYLLFFRKRPDIKRKDIEKPIFRVAAGENQEGKQECLDYRDRVIAKLKEINQKSKRLYIVEHILLRPIRKKALKMTLELTVPGLDEHLVFKSVESLHAEEWNEMAEDLLIFGTEASNYELKQTGGGNNKKYQLILLRNGKPTLQTEAFSIQERPDKVKDAVVKEMTRIRDYDPGELDQFLQQIDLSQDSDVIKENYNLQRISLVLPSWPVPFQSESDFRFFFRHFVARIIPAHLKATYHWMNTRQMQKFEKAYHDWEQLKAMQTGIFDLFEQAQTCTDFNAEYLTEARKELTRKFGKSKLLRSTSTYKDMKDYHQLLKQFEEALDTAALKVYNCLEETKE